jgi:betaine-aldehyde dehydrogenase
MSATLKVPATATRPELPLPPTNLFIGGEWSEAADVGSFAVIDPSSSSVIADVASATADDVDRAVRAARHQVDSGAWAALSGRDRGLLLNRLADLLERDTTYVAQLEALDVGRPIGESVINVTGGIAALRYFAGWADKIDGRYVPVPELNGRPRHCYTRREPVGVVAAITPWNAPIWIACWKIAPALAAGCAVVLKPAEDAPLSTLHLANLVREAGFPAGTVNVIPGLGETAGAPLACHAGVDMVWFTGSPEVGREVARAAADTFKRVGLELGGKSPQIIFADADLGATIPAAARAFTSNAGQICVAGTRILVERPVVEEVAANLGVALEAIKVGDPFDKETTMGTLINEAQLERVLHYIETGHEQGAKLVTGGKQLGEAGFFVEPTLFEGTNELTIAQEEIFGPVAIVTPFDDFDEAIAIANDTRYGLAAGVWTTDLSKAHRAAANIRA